MGGRLFSDDELAALSMSGAERVAEALKTGDAGETRNVFGHVLAQYRPFHDLCHGCTASLFAFLNDTHGHEACKAMPGHAVQEPETTGSRQRRRLEHLKRGDDPVSMNATERALDVGYRDRVRGLVTASVRLVVATSPGSP